VGGREQGACLARCEVGVGDICFSDSRRKYSDWCNKPHSVTVVANKTFISQLWYIYMYNMCYMHNRNFLRCISHILGHRRIKRLIKNCVGGEKTSREFPKCHSKNVEKNGNSIESRIDRKPLSWRKLISSVSVFILLSMSGNLKNRLKIRTTGDISTALWFE